MRKKKQKTAADIIFPPHTLGFIYFPDLNFVTFSLTSVRPDCVGAVLDS